MACAIHTIDLCTIFWEDNILFSCGMVTFLLAKDIVALILIGRILKERKEWMCIIEKRTIYNRVIAGAVPTKAPSL